MLSPGQKLAVDFPVKAVTNGVAKDVSFGDLLTRRTIVSVYMKNNTPSCDRQNESLAAHAADFDRAGYNLVGLSRNTCGSHVRYAREKHIDYVLVSDPDDNFARAADALVEKSMYGRSFVGPQRAAFVLDRDGTILAIAPRVDPANHAAQVKALIAAL